MPLFKQKLPCPYCGATVAEPKAGESTKCPNCHRPGPWAPASERAEYERQAAEAQAREAERRSQELQLALALTPVAAPGFVAQKSEEVYLTVPARLFGWKKERGHYEGGPAFRGVSARVPGTKSMRAYYGGFSQRKYVQGIEHWKQTADGSAVVSSKRIVFRSATQNVEWAYAKLVGLDVDPNSSALVLQVSNRQASHVLNVDDIEVLTLKVEAALAAFQGRPAPTLSNGNAGADAPPPRPD